jgi:hypothetical protein
MGPLGFPVQLVGQHLDVGPQQPQRRQNAQPGREGVRERQGGRHRKLRRQQLRATGRGSGDGTVRLSRQHDRRAPATRDRHGLREYGVGHVIGVCEHDVERADPRGHHVRHHDRHRTGRAEQRRQQAAHRRTDAGTSEQHQSSGPGVDQVVEPHFGRGLRRGPHLGARESRRSQQPPGVGIRQPTGIVEETVVQHERHPSPG